MKRIFAVIAAAVTMIVLGSTASAKSAVVVAHYGSSDDDTRAKTIGLITGEVREALPSMEVREAYISPVVRRNLAKRGIDTKSPLEVLLGLRAEGYDTVYVQSSTLIDGAEMAEVRKAVEQTAPFFKLVKAGRPLLYSPDDCLEVASILLKEPCGKGEAVVYAGHGNVLPSTATYAQLDHMLATSPEAKGVYHVSTIEGYPTAASTIAQLAKGPKVKTVKLVPLLLVCGNHTRNDIAGEYAEAVRKAGYEPQVVMRGLGENPEIRAIYVNRVKELLGR